jgi:hypothetical protein
MIDMPNPENREKVAALIARYNQISGDIVRYRDIEWKIIVWVVALLAGVIALTRPGQPTLSACMKSLFVIFSVAVGVYGIWHLHYAHRRLTEERQRRRDCERILGFYDKGKYDPGASLLPEKWATEEVTYKQGIGHLVSWWILIAAITAFSVYSVVVAG